ncbi:MAG TPA: DUF3298 domain-containing protein [Ignavibacteria bacterium]|jgi:hypothetical protein
MSVLFSPAHAVGQNYKIEHKKITVKSEDKKYEINITYPQIQGLSIPSEEGFNTLVKGRMEAERDSFIVWMKDWEINDYNKDFTSEYEIGDSVFLANSKLISVQFYQYYYFAGAAHPNNSSFSINYDLENNRELFLSDLLTTGWEKKISEISIREISKQKKKYGIDPDDWLKEGAGPNAENFKVFNIAKKYLVITFPTYQVGAYVEGPSEVKISYKEIKDIIKKDGQLKQFLIPG